MPKYLIGLTPVGRFFFGGEKTFANSTSGESRHFSYIIESQKFPQQTSLLGMLRFLLLRNCKEAFDSGSQCIINTEDAKALADAIIGKQGFRAKEQSFNFGNINELSHCFLQVKIKNNNWVALERVPKDAHLNVDFSKCTEAFINDKKVDVPKMDYDAKEGIETTYLCPCCGQETKESDIFEKDIRNGIARDIITGLTSDNALFKQISYRLKEGYRFAFYVNIADSFDNNLEDYDKQIVSVGGDSSQFAISIQKCDEQKKMDDSANEQSVESAPEGDEVVLLSPAYLTKKDLASVIFAITDTIPFRSMETTTASAGPYCTKRNMCTTTRFLYDTGSVFYFRTLKDAQNFGKKLEGHANFYKIGYNRYKISF